MPVNNIQIVRNSQVLPSSAIKNDENELPAPEKKTNYDCMIGATVLASVVALGILGHNGRLGVKVQKILGGAKSKGSPIEGLTPQKKAQKALEQLYDKVIAKAKNDGNTKRVSIFEQAKNNINTLDKKTTYGNLLEALYKDLRLGEYPASDIITKNIDDITSKCTKSTIVRAQNGWHYRMPLRKIPVKSADRISVNALADKNLIKELDDLFASGKVKGYYKTPENSLNWLERHDPITIYLDEKATPQTLEDVKSVCEKYIRSKEDVLLGNKFAPGMALQKSPNEQDIMEVLAQAKAVDEDLESVLRVNFTNHSNGKLITSAGYIDSAKKLIDLVKS